MKIYTLFVGLLLIFVGCNHFEARHSTSTGTGASASPSAASNK